MSRRTNYSKYSTLKVEHESFGEVQNKASSRVYIFGNDSSEDISTDDCLFELSEMRTRVRAKGSTSSSSQDLKKNFLLEREIKENDTLQRFALNFGCTMEEIKRANNLYSEQDFHALQTIKIPVYPHGLLAEQEENRKPKLKPIKLVPTWDTHIEENGDCIRTVSIRSALDSPHSFLKNMDKDLSNICKGTPLRKANLDEVARTLTVNCIHPLRLQSQKRDLGTICGMGWKWFVVLVVVVCVIIPAFLAVFWLWYKRKS